MSVDDLLETLRGRTGLLWGSPILRSPLPHSDRIVLRRRHALLRNAFETIGDVRLQPGGMATQLLVTYRTNYLAAAFMTVWLGFVIAFNLVLMVLAASGSVHLGDLGLTLLFPAFGFGFVALGRLLALPDRTALMEFLGNATEGRLAQ